MNATQTIAAKYVTDFDFEPASTYQTLAHEYEVYTCGHYGNCDCGGDVRNATIGYYAFEDGSIYCDDLGLDRAFDSTDDLIDWLNTSDGHEALIESEPTPCFCRGDHCYC